MSFLNKKQLKQLGLKNFGSNVLISDKASIYSPHLISIGSNVRIDDFCILTGQITLGNQIHIGAYSALYGKFGIVFKDYTGLSPRCTIFSATDDFGGNYLISPMNKEEYTNVTGGQVVIEKYCQIGSGTLIMPSVIIAEGVAVGSMSLVRESLYQWGIYAGIPAKRLKDRSKGLLKFVLNADKSE